MPLMFTNGSVTSIRYRGDVLSDKNGNQTEIIRHQTLRQYKGPLHHLVQSSLCIYLNDKISYVPHILQLMLFQSRSPFFHYYLITDRENNMDKNIPAKCFRKGLFKWH